MGCLQQYQAEKIVEQATWTSSNNIKSWYSSKEGFVISLVGLQRNCLFWTLTTQPNDQFCCLHWTTNEISCSTMQLKKSSPNWQIEMVLYSIMTMQGHIHLWSLCKNYWSLVGMFCHIHHIVLTLHHLITFCFDLYKTFWMVKISIMMMISNSVFC